jgi:hypothetical protein
MGIANILALVENPNKIVSSRGGWDKKKIVSGSGSKNIPLLDFAHDLLLADRTNDQKDLNEAWNALGGYFAHGRVRSHFHGEEYSTIYWRWIVIPVWIAGRIAEKRGRADMVVQVDKWLQDFITLNALAALPSTHYVASEHSKYPGRNLFGMPCAGIMGARSWIFNKGDDGKRTWDDSMSWVDATSHAPWLAWVLGRAGVNELTGGDHWVARVTRGVVNIYGPREVLNPNAALELNTALNNGSYPANLVDAMEYGPSKPMVIGRTTKGTWCLGERSFTSGSTSFMHCKVLPSNTLSYKVYGIAHPLKRSNQDPATAVLSPDFRSAVITADDGTVFDWATKKEVKGTLTVPLLDGDFLWVVRVAAGSKPVRLDRTQNGDDDTQNGHGWCDWFTDLFS